jgi:hypothetical protein
VQSPDGLVQLARLATRASRHRVALDATAAELAGRVARTRELLLRDVPTTSGRVPFVLIGPCGVFALTVAGGAVNTEDDFAVVRRHVEALRRLTSHTSCVVRGAVVLTDEGAQQTPHYFQGGRPGSEGGFHVGVRHLDTFFDLFSDGVSVRDLGKLRAE